MPVIGLLHPGSPEANARYVAGFRKGLAETSYVEGRNVSIEYRWGHGEVTRLPELAADLVRRAASVIVTPGGVAAALADVQAAAAAMGHPLDIVAATTGREITPAFKEAVQKRADAILISPDPLFASHPVQLATLAARHAMPAIYALREFAEGGGLISYGSNFTDMFRQAGTYVARILKSEKPADLPILQATKFELVINLQTAEAFGLDVPPQLLALADEVIE
jgi:putative ABC transport system substrate-binding protein